LQRACIRRAPATADSSEFTRFVNPFIGTGGYGNTFPGPSMPSGMIQRGPDTAGNGFYKYQSSTIRGFSLTYLNGGGCPIFADVRILPMVAEVFASPATNLADYAQAFSHRNEAAEPRFYSVALGSVSSRQR